VKLSLPRGKVLSAAVQISVILIVHAVLVRVLAGTDIVATILSAGPHAPTGHLLIAAVFVVARLLALLLLPGIILSHLVGIALDKWVRRGDAGPEGQTRTPSEDGTAGQAGI
jgi:hypothetical protein